MLLLLLIRVMVVCRVECCLLLPITFFLIPPIFATSESSAGRRGGKKSLSVDKGAILDCSKESSPMEFSVSPRGVGTVRCTCFASMQCVHIPFAVVSFVK